MRSEWIEKSEVEHILAALTTENRLACLISLATGLRLNDVLSIKTEQARKGRFTIREQKTGKSRLVRLPVPLQQAALCIAGQHYVFENRLDGKKHRTRQAVFKDLRRAAVLFRVKEHITPHSMRKIYAVEEYARHGDLKRVQKLLNHSDEAVTMLYAMANCVRKNTKSRKRK